MQMLAPPRAKQAGGSNELSKRDMMVGELRLCLDDSGSGQPLPLGRWTRAAPEATLKIDNWGTHFIEQSFVPSAIC